MARACSEEPDSTSSVHLQVPNLSLCLYPALPPITSLLRFSESPGPTASSSEALCCLLHPFPTSTSCTPVWSNPEISPFPTRGWLQSSSSGGLGAPLWPSLQSQNLQLLSLTQAQIPKAPTGLRLLGLQTCGQRADSAQGSPGGTSQHWLSLRHKQLRSHICRGIILSNGLTIQMGKLWPREGKGPAQDHTARH